MTILQKLPTNDPPKPLTANARVKKLGDHLFAFLSANNPTGFPELPSAKEVENLERTSIGNILLIMAQKETVSLTEFKKTAWEIRHLSGEKLKVGHIHQILARLYGYYTYAAISTQMKKNPVTGKKNKQEVNDFVVINRQYDKGINVDIFNDLWTKHNLPGRERKVTNE